MDSQIYDKLYEFAYKMAFRDATMRNAFRRLDDEEESHFKAIKEEMRNNYVDYVKEYIEAIFREQYPQPLEYIEKISNPGLVNHNERFTFGNAQKLINMTAKYMFLSCYQDETKRELFRNCDCPMDSFMIKKVECNHDKGFNHDLAWSRITFSNHDAYDYFQEQIRKQCGRRLLPIEYDYLHWDE